MNNSRKWLWSVLLIAAILRIAVLSFTAGNLQQDVDLYRGIAESIARGEGYAFPGTGLPTAYRPPLYPLLLALLIRCGGGLLTIGIAQVIIGLGTVALTYCVGCRLHLGRLSVFAAWLVAIDPLLLHNTTLVMTETLAAFLTALLLWIVLRVASADVDRTKIFWGLLLGIVLGLSCLCRPTYAVFGGLTVAMAAKAWFSGRKTKPLHLPPAATDWRVPLAIVLGGAVVMAPWVVRNWRVLGRPIASTTHGGYTLLLGHNSVYYKDVVEQPWGTVWGGESLAAWDRSLKAEMAADGISSSDEVARDAWMYRQAWTIIRQNPLMAGRAGLTLAGRFWNIIPLAEGKSPRQAPVKYAVGVFYGAWWVLLILGMFRLSFQEWSAWWPCVLLVLSFTAIHFLYWADMRMRAPLAPALALIAARGLAGSRVSLRTSPQDSAGPVTAGVTH